MSDSLLNKSTVILNAIAITAALAVISGQLSLNPLSQLPASLSFNHQRGQLTPRP
ncbi:hypothetical protein [Leptothermofonsia sp. ETS-13]|uniref:hypothetical protein n=1 Tax=Leptothermofonsia sp. ETS-13 TaxID=3035696 RepID=UPI003B9DCBCC